MAKKTEITDEQFYKFIDDIAEKNAKIELLKAQCDNEVAKLKKQFDTEIIVIELSKKSVFKTVQKFAIENRKRLLGDDKSSKTLLSIWGFEETPAKVIPVAKVKDEAMVEQLKLIANNKGLEYLTVKYALDKSKIADALDKKIAWVKTLFQQTKSEKFFVKTLEK